MSDGGGLNRREFLQRSALGGAAAGVAARRGDALPFVPANERITVGMIGVGARAQELMEAIQQLPVAEIVGVCDAYKGRQERAVARTKGRAKIYRDYHEILADRSIDTVVIATPDHWHARMAVDAVRAGKDVYIEKPLTYTIEEGNTIIDEVKKSGRILQVGSQGMSSLLQQKAREIIASGRLGQVTMIRAFYNRNTPGGAWIYPIPPDASPETVDWEMFLGPAPKRPVDYARFFRWRCYRDYSGGIATDLFVHLCTSIHFMMNAKMPAHVVAMGQLYRWKESRDVPDTINAILEYPEGFTANLSSTFNNQFSAGQGFQIMGTKGTLSLGGGLAFYPEVVHDDNRWIVESWPAKMEEGYYRDPKVRAEEIPSSREPQIVEGSEQMQEIGFDPTVLHFRAFFESVKARKPPAEDALVGHRAASCAHLINRSARDRKMVSWNFGKETIQT
jgi:predicted dehydrogenase